MKSKLSPVSIGLAIRTLRNEHKDPKFSAKELAEKAGISPSAISRIESGLRGLELQDAVLIACALDTTVQVIVETAMTLEKSGVVSKHLDALDQLRVSLEGAREAAQAAVKIVDKMR